MNNYHLDEITRLYTESVKTERKMASSPNKNLEGLWAKRSEILGRFLSRYITLERSIKWARRNNKKEKLTEFHQNQYLLWHKATHLSHPYTLSERRFRTVFPNPGPYRRDERFRGVGRVSEHTEQRYYRTDPRTNERIYFEGYDEETDDPIWYKETAKGEKEYVLYWPRVHFDWY